MKRKREGGGSLPVSVVLVVVVVTLSLRPGCVVFFYMIFLFSLFLPTHRTTLGLVAFLCVCEET